MIHRYVRDKRHELTIYVNFEVKFMCYIGLGSNGCFMAGAALTSDHYKTDITLSQITAPTPLTINNIWKNLNSLYFTITNDSMRFHYLRPIGVD